MPICRLGAPEPRTVALVSSLGSHLGPQVAVVEVVHQCLLSFQCNESVRSKVTPGDHQQGQPLSWKVFPKGTGPTRRLPLSLFSK